MNKWKHNWDAFTATNRIINKITQLRTRSSTIEYYLGYCDINEIYFVSTKKLRNFYNYQLPKGKNKKITGRKRSIIIAIL